MKVLRLSLVMAMMSGLFLACGEETNGPGTDATVDVADDVFNPTATSVDVGESVTWEWQGSNTHNVTFVNPINGGSAPASATQATGTYSLTFSTAGDFDYYCTIHGTPTSGMRGSVAVQ
jgi:plastocyanin